MYLRTKEGLAARKRFEGKLRAVVITGVLRVGEVGRGQGGRGHLAAGSQQLQPSKSSSVGWQRSSKDSRCYILTQHCCPPVLEIHAGTRAVSNITHADLSPDPVKVIDLPGIDVTAVLKTDLLISSSVMDTAAASEDLMLRGQGREGRGRSSPPGRGAYGAGQRMGGTAGEPLGSHLAMNLTAEDALDREVAPLQVRLHCGSEEERDDWYRYVYI
jgi:hypothetical protein